MKKFFKFTFMLLFMITTFLFSIKTLTKAADIYPFNGIINADALVIREKASNKSRSVTELAYGTRVEVLSSEKEFYKIKFDNGKIAYGLKNYIINIDSNTQTTSVNGFETYDDFCKKMESIGFPNSYCPYLYYLHINHPKWIFEADKTGLSFDDAINSETGKVVLATSNKNYWLSNEIHEKNYHYIKSNVIASFMDPRNSLFEPTIFQFLDLERSKDISNEKSLERIVGNGNLKKYIPEFQKAASMNNINALHILSRSMQEGANRNGYSAISGKYTTNTGLKIPNTNYSLDGYYNFYNIGSFIGTGYKDTIQGGLTYASGLRGIDEKCIIYDPNTGIAKYDEKCGKLSYQRPWDNPLKAISGGAEFIAEGYIRKGQDNLYFQKFNVSSYSHFKKYTHQYMTNIHAAASESTSMYRGYQSGELMDEAFVFVIPVYMNLPNDNIQPIDKSSDNKLSIITIDGKEITGYDPDVLEYQYNVVTNKDSIIVDAKTSSPKAQIKGLGEYKFENDNVNITLEVIAEDQSKQNYNIKVHRVLPVENVKVIDIVNKLGVKANDETIYDIKINTNVNELISTIEKNKGTAKVYDAQNNEKKNDILKTGDKIIIKGSAEEKEFKIAIKGDINGDGKVDLKDYVLVQSHILDVREIKDIYFYAGDVNYDNKITLADFVLVQSHILGVRDL